MRGVIEQNLESYIVLCIVPIKFLLIHRGEEK